MNPVPFFNITQEVYSEETLFFLRELLDRDLKHLTEGEWEFDSKKVKSFNPEDWGEVLFRSLQSRNNDSNIIISHNNYLIHLGLGKKRVNTLKVAAATQEISTEIWNSLAELFPQYDDEDGKVRVKFWYSTKNGPVSHTRPIAVPSWNAIRHNYGYETRQALDSLMDFHPVAGGQLILWHGVPGTGKTFALRALCEHWKPWCKSDYILDPEQLFSDPSYLTSLILGTEGEIDEEGNPVNNESDWKLLILEDTGELLSEDAKERTGQGLSRLLNLADGFIGQGLKVIILITTNERIDKIHKAVARPGRAAAMIEFSTLDRKAVAEWCALQKIDDLRQSDITVAELYEYINSSKQIVNKAPKTGPGFRMAVA